jgi:hypothetical protein
MNLGPIILKGRIRTYKNNRLKLYNVVKTKVSLQRSQYSDWLRAERSRGRSSTPGKVKNFLVFTSSRPALGPTQPPIQKVPGGSFPGGKAAGA